MNILLRTIALVGIVVLVSLPAEAQNVKVVGGTVSTESEIAPSGFCAGTITMTDGGTVATGIDLNAVVSFKAGSLENSYEGVGYLYGNNGKFGGNTDIRVVTFDLGQTPTVVTGNVSVSFNQNPDINNAVEATVYNPALSGGNAFTVFGTKQVAPCTVGLVNCLHTRSYQNTTTGVDISDTSILMASGAYEAHLPSNRDSYWIARNSSGGNTITKLSTSYALVGTTGGTANGYAGMTSDDTYIYATVDILGVQTLRRIHRTTLAISDFAILGILSGAMAHVDGFLYIGQTSRIMKVRTSDMVSMGTVAIGAGDFALKTGIAYDAANGVLYVTNRNGASVQIQRINLATFTVAQTLGRAYGANQTYAVGYDFPKKHIWIAAAENSATLMKTNLCS